MLGLVRVGIFSWVPWTHKGKSALNIYHMGGFHMKVSRFAVTILLEYMTVLLEYFNLSTSAVRVQLRFGGPSPALGYATEK